MWGMWLCVCVRVSGGGSVGGWVGVHVRVGEIKLSTLHMKSEL